jgi:hypothetical protein
LPLFCPKKCRFLPKKCVFSPFFAIFSRCFLPKKCLFFLFFVFAGDVLPFCHQWINPLVTATSPAVRGLQQNVTSGTGVTRIKFAIRFFCSICA